MDSLKEVKEKIILKKLNQLITETLIIFNLYKKVLIKNKNSGS